METQVPGGAILIVEDVETCAETLDVALAGTLGLEVLCVSSGLEALRLVHNGRPPIRAVVTDLNMPLLDGFELIRQIRADSRYVRLPIIVVSGDTNPSAPARTLEAGADAYFSKPYSPARVRQKLEQLLNAKPTSEF